jgi:hypothetical protein
MVNINKILWGIGVIMLGMGLCSLPELSNLIITWIKDYFPNITNLSVFMNSLSGIKKTVPIIREFYQSLILIIFMGGGLYLVYIGLKEPSDEE